MSWIIVRQRFIRNELPPISYKGASLFESREKALQIASLLAAEEKANLDMLKQPLDYVDNFFTSFNFDFSIGQTRDNITRIVSGYKVLSLDKV